MGGTVTKLANANQAVSETVAWGTPTNAYSSSDATASATNTPSAKSQSNTRSWGFPAFTTSDIPDGSTINAVTLRFSYKSSVTTSTGAVLGIQGDNSGATIGSETTFTMNTAFSTQTKDLTGLVTLADLRNANGIRARVRSNRSTSNTGITWSLDYVQLEVTWATPPISGTAGDTLDAVTSSAAGAVAVQGTGSSTIDAVTASAAGTVSSLNVSGAADITIAAVALSAAGAVIDHGLASATIAAVTPSAAGTVAVQGAAADTIAAVTSSGAGAVAVKGAEASTIDHVATAAAGAVTVKGTTSATIDAVALSAAGGGVLSPISGAASIAIAVVSLAAAGKTVTTGAASDSIGSVSVSAAGQNIDHGLSSATLAAITGVAAGAVHVSGAVTKTIDAVTLAAAAQGPPNSGVLNVTIGNVTLTGTMQIVQPRPRPREHDRIFSSFSRIRSFRTFTRRR